MKFQTYKFRKIYKCDGKECQACKNLIINAFHRANGDNFPIARMHVSQLSNNIDESICMKNWSIARNAVGSHLLITKNETNKINLFSQLIEFVKVELNLVNFIN